MTTQVRIALMLAALAVLGCKGVQPTSAASGAGAGEGGSSSGLLATVTGGGTRVSWFRDPSLNNMNAFSVKAPAGWQVQGAIQMSGCTSVPSAVFRASSPDGKIRSEQMPLFGWQWGTGPVFVKNNRCLPLEGPMTADDFLKYLAAVMKVNYDGPEAVPAAIIAQHKASAEQFAARFPQIPPNHEELALARVSFQVGSVQMKGRLSVTLDCSQGHFPPQRQLIYPRGGGMPHWTQTDPTTINNCVAYIKYISAPANQLASVINRWEADQCGAKDEQSWLQADSERRQQQGDAILRNAARIDNEQMQAQHDRFEQNQAVNQRMHDEFLNTMQRGTDMSMARTQQSMNSRSTATSDWVDYSLDRQTVMDMRNGATYKLPNQVTVQNPLTQVHGDGTPIQ
jgi:hypothetical protein